MQLPNNELVNNFVPTEDKGFLILSISNPGPLAHHYKYDSTGAFQNGYSYHYYEWFQSAARYGKLFKVTATEYYKFTLAKFDIATGQMEKRVTFSGSTFPSAYMGPGPSEIIATQDSGLIVTFSVQQSQGIAATDLYFFKLDKNLNHVFSSATTFPSGNFANSTGSGVENADGSISIPGTFVLPGAVNVGVVLRFDGSNGAQLGHICFQDSIGTYLVFDLLADGPDLFCVGRWTTPFVMALPQNLAGPLWARKYDLSAPNAGPISLVRLPNDGFLGAMDGAAVAFADSGQLQWAKFVDSISWPWVKVPVGGDKALLKSNGNNARNRYVIFDSLGQGLCSQTGPIATDSSFIPLVISQNINTSHSSIAQMSKVQDTLLPATPIVLNPETICSELCQITADFTFSTNLLNATFSSLIPQASIHFWTFGDGATGYGQAPSHTYAAPGTYQVCYVAGTDCMSDTACQMVTVIETAAATAFASGFTIMPIPASETVVVRCPAEIGVDAKLRVVGITGAMVMESRVSDGKTQIDVRQWNAGIYIVEIESGGRIWRTRMVVE